VLSSDDPLDKADFNPIDYINGIFPTEQSLSNIDDVLNRMKAKIRQLDEEIRVVVRGQNNVEKAGKEALEEAKQVIAQLTSRIIEMKAQAKKSEQMVNEITCDIKQLDNAKKNLTSSIIMLNNLHILVEGVDKLEEATQKREYAQAAAILQSVVDVLNQLENHKHIPHIRVLAHKVETIRLKLAEQIIADFHSTFEGPNSKHSISHNQLRLLAEACLVVSSLDSRVKHDILTWFVNLELLEYKALFQENQDIAWLDKIEKRYNWLKKHLMEFEDRFGKMFPIDWEVSECIAIEFCKVTANELCKVMSNRLSEINVKLLLYAIGKTVTFENLLTQRFSRSISYERKDIKQISFSGLISHCFEQHLNIYVDAQSENLSKLIEQFVDEYQKTKNNEILSAEVFPSAGILFTQYKHCLVQCVQLSTRKPLVSLTTTFQKYLREYAHRILQNNLPRVGGPSLATSSLSSGGVLSAATSAAGILQSLLKEGEVTRFTKSELCQICSILLTSNYCLETVQQLEKKLQEKVDPAFVDNINMKGEQDLFHGIITSCIQMIIQDIESGCEPAFNVMIKTQWSTVETPIGQSAYVTTITNHLQQIFPFIRENLQEARKHFTQLCNKFAVIFIPKFINNLFKCKNLSQGGAEQLLLDTHTLKKVLLELPGWESVVKTAPGSYTKTVIKGMTKAEMILKVVLVPCERIESFIENYNKLLPDSDENELHKILDMKGVRRAEINLLLEAYRNAPKGDSKDIHEAIQNNIDHESSKIKRLENLIKKNVKV
ncbi:vacuolar protein sorting-associated protein 53-like protein, partial [Dinothrombium tinctorium]